MYVRELDNCVHGVKYAVVGQDGIMENQANVHFADDACLMASSKDDMNVIMEKVNEYVIEYGELEEVKGKYGRQ